MSLIVSIYNVEKYLKKCINSLLNQNMESYEIILINDGSTDKSLNVCEEFLKKYNNIKLIDKNNGGLSSARNRGLNEANGEYVLFIDGDDYIEKDSLNNIYKEIIERNLEILKLQYWHVNEQGQKIISNNNNKVAKMKNHQLIISGKSFLLLNPLDYLAPIYIFKREFLLEKKLFFKEGIYHEDNEFTPRALYECERFMECSLVFYYYVQREGSITTRGNIKKSFDLIETADYYYDFHKQISDENQKEFFRKYSIELYLKAIHTAINQGIDIKLLLENNIIRKKIEKVLLGSNQIKHKILFIFIRLGLMELYSIFYRIRGVKNN